MDRYYAEKFTLPSTRGAALFWLDYFGKFSMADLFAALSLIAYIRLDVHEITAKQIATNLFNGLPAFVANSTNTTAMATLLC